MGKEEIRMTDHEKLYEERKKRVETAVSNREPDKVPNTLLVGTYPLHKAGITMAESMVDHEKACRAMLAFYEKYAYTDTGSISNFTPAAKVLENLGMKNARWPGDPKGTGRIHPGDPAPNAGPGQRQAGQADPRHSISDESH